MIHATTLPADYLGEPSVRAAQRLNQPQLQGHLETGQGPAGQRGMDVRSGWRPDDVSTHLMSDSRAWAGSVVASWGVGGGSSSKL